MHRKFSSPTRNSILKTWNTFQVGDKKCIQGAVGGTYFACSNSSTFRRRKDLENRMMTHSTPLKKNRPSKKDGRSSSPSIPKQCGSAKLAFLVSRFGWTVHNPTFWGLNFEPTISTSPPTRKDVMKIYVLGLPTKIQSKTPNTSWFLSAEICKSLRDVSVNHLPPRSINESSHGWSLQWTRISNTKKSLKSCIGFTFRTNSRVLNTFSTEGSIQNQQGGPLLVINGVITEPLSMAL